MRVCLHCLGSNLANYVSTFLSIWNQFFKNGINLTLQWKIKQLRKQHWKIIVSHCVPKKTNVEVCVREVYWGGSTRALLEEWEQQDWADRELDWDAGTAVTSANPRGSMDLKFPWPKTDYQLFLQQKKKKSYLVSAKYLNTGNGGGGRGTVPENLAWHMQVPACQGQENCSIEGKRSLEGCRKQSPWIFIDQVLSRKEEESCFFLLDFLSS